MSIQRADVAQRLLPERSEWEHEAPPEVINLGGVAAWDSLRDRYERDRIGIRNDVLPEGQLRLLPWRRALAVAQATGATSAVIERRYC